MKKLSMYCNILVFTAILTIAVYPQKAGEIIFSKKIIDPSNPSELTNTFGAGDNIYSVAYLSDNFIELSERDNPKKLEAEVFIYELKPPLYDYQKPSEMQLETSTLWLHGDAMSKNFVPLDILPSPDEMTAYSEEIKYQKFGDKFYGPVRFAEKIGKLEPGKHELIIKLKFNYQDVAEGRLIIEGNDFSAYKKLAKQINTVADESRIKVTQMPPASMTDKKLEKEMISVFTASQSYKDRVKGEVVKIVITDSDWHIRRNDLTGIILNRYIRASIAVKDKEGTCTVWPAVFQQDYIGNNFQKTKFDGLGDPFKIPCDNIK